MLPVKINLVRRNVIADDICEQCKQLPEDMINAIWLCSEILVCRSLTQLENFTGQNTFLSFWIMSSKLLMRIKI